MRSVGIVAIVAMFLAFMSSSPPAVNSEVILRIDPPPPAPTMIGFPPPMPYRNPMRSGATQ